MTSTAADELVLIERAAQGDGDATEELLRQNFSALCKVVRKVMGTSEYPLAAIDDIVQETMIEAYKNIAGFKPVGENAVLRWMATIAYNKLADAVRIAKALKRGGGMTRATGQGGWSRDSLVAIFDQVSSPTKSPSRIAATDEAVGCMRVAIARLKEDYRAAIQHRFIDGRTVAETAQLMNRTAKSVEHLCERAMESLRASMGSGSRFLSAT